MNVTSATPSNLRSAGMTVSTPLMAGHSPGLSSARWIWRYCSSPGVAEMIFECGPFQYPDSGHGGIFQFHDQFAPVAVEFLDR